MRGQQLAAIKLLYKQSEVCIRVNGMKTKPFNVSVELRQGCTLSPLLFIIYIDKIERDSSSSSGITFGECKVWRLMFADHLALLSSNKSDLQYALDRFSDACLDCGMKISTVKTEIMCMLMHPIECLFETNRVTLQQTEKFKYLGFTFSSDGKQNNDLDTRIGEASSVIRQLYRSVLLNAVYKSKVFCLHISFCSYLHLWS